jgi:N-acyl-D-aspartate/D-glutamate deacylase
VGKPRPTLIRGGSIADGIGTPLWRGDVLLEHDRIVDIGAVGAADDALIVDAAGCVVAPGFIDLHSHADFSILAFPDAASATRQGVTTIVVGNCGGGVAPANPAFDVRRVAFGYSSQWGPVIDWSNFDEYLARIRDVAVNVVALLPHGALRNAVMGLASRSPSESEMDRMVSLTEAALASGAAGLSSGLEYQPGCFATHDELSRLATIVAKHDGVYATHMRNRAEQFAAATQEALQVGRATGARVQLSHVAPRPYAPRAQVDAAFAEIERARADGFDIGVDTFPEVWGPGNLVDLLPGEIAQGSPDEMLRRLRAAGTRRKVADSFARGDNFLIRAAGLEQILISSSPVHPEYAGRSITELALERRQSVAEFCCDALLEADVLLMSVGIRHVYATEDDLRHVLTLPYCSLESDGVVGTGEDSDCAFPWSASTYGYSVRALEHYAREQSLLTLEETVRKLTSLPAQAVGLRDRGVLRAGASADVVVFDFHRLHDRTTPEHPARHPAGIRHVLVNGVSVVEAGTPTRARPGRRL